MVATAPLPTKCSGILPLSAAPTLDSRPLYRANLIRTGCHLNAESMLMSRRSQQQQPSEKLAVDGPGVQEPKKEHEHLLGSTRWSAQSSICRKNMRCHTNLLSSGAATALPCQAPPLLKLPCSLSQPCFRSLQNRFSLQPFSRDDTPDTTDAEETSSGPTQILDFVFLGSQQDALDPDMLEVKLLNQSQYFSKVIITYFAEVRDYKSDQPERELSAARKTT